MNKTSDLAKNLINVSWNQINIGQKKFSLKLYLGSLDLIEMMLFDIDEFQIFYLNQNSEQIEKQLKELNPSLEAPVNKILQHLESCLNEKNEKNQYSIFFQSEYLLIKMQSKLSGIKFNWEFKLNKLENLYLKQHFVIPLLFNCAEYQQRELELIKIIQSKDKELDDYKSQGIELTRKYLATEIFEIGNFDDQIKSKSQIDDLIEDPTICLSTNLHHKVHKSCIEKYLALNTKSQSKSTNNDSKSTENSNPILKNSEKNNDLLKEKKREQIDKVLEEENKSCPKVIKKKKLFK